MKTTAILLASMWAAAVMAHAQPVERKYTGTSVVTGFGKVAFPDGEWLLEHQRIQHPTNSVLIPDHFVFRRAGDRLERLTFLRYPQTNPPRQLVNMLDTVGETMGDGLPLEHKEPEERTGSEIYRMCLEPPLPTQTERSIAFSFINVRPSPKPSWLCHSLLFLHEGSAFVMAHTSTSVISPDTVSEVKFRSQFKPTSRQSDKPAGPRLSEAEIFSIAARVAEREGIRLANYEEPRAEYKAGTWTVFYEGKDRKKIGNHFSVSVDDLTLVTSLKRGE